jgi:phosphatidylserine/phosphatidylglycerophosphate/cardiolipin synthase-like enzyme
MSRRLRDRLLPLAALLCAGVVMLSSCTLPAGLSASSTPTSCTSDSGSSCSVGTGATNLQLFTEPDDGVQPVPDVMHNAKKSVRVEVYILTDTAIINALEDDANQGLDVRVMLEPHPFGFSPVSVQETIDKLKAAGIKVNQTSPAFQLTHAKFMLIDSSTLFLMTANLSQTAFGGSKSFTNREYLLDDTEPQDVQEAENIFHDDWSRTVPTLSDANLVVSPVNARAKLLALINSGQSSLFTEDEEMQDQQTEDALIQAARRGLNVEIVLPVLSSGSDGSAAGVVYPRNNHVNVREDKQLYMHAKLIIVDGTRAFVGSENFSSASLDKNRELGLIVADPNTIQSLEATFTSDYAASQ